MVSARAEFLSKRNNNLLFLLQNRYGWMNRFIRQDDTVVELGAGAGFSKKYVKNNFILTEISPHPWIDVCMDAMNLPFGADTIDVVICDNVPHHLATPIKFLQDLHRCIKPGGYVPLFEPNPSFLLLLALRMMRHEGWSFEVDVFDPAVSVNDPADPWSGNNAISYLMFRNRSVFEKNAR